MHAETSHLVCFDFDHTLVDANSDVWVYGIPPVCGSLPEAVKGSYQDGRCTRLLALDLPDPARLDYMGRIFMHLSSRGVTHEALRTHMAAIPWTPGMPALLSRLRTADRTACAILSDSNTLFIDWILEGAGGRDTFAQVLTNPAEWVQPAVHEGETSQSGVLTVRPFHSHTCSRCNDNMCKREALQQLIAQYRSPAALHDPTPTHNHHRQDDDFPAGNPQQPLQQPHRQQQQPTNDTSSEQLQQQQRRPPCPPPPPPPLRVIFVGDGRNDLCAALALGPDDVVMCRSGFPLDRILTAARPASCPVNSGLSGNGGGVGDVSSGVTSVGHDGGPGYGGGVALREVAAGVTARVVRWSTGEDVLRWMEQQGVW